MSIDISVWLASQSGIYKTKRKPEKQSEDKNTYYFQYRNNALGKDSLFNKGAETVG